MKKNRLNILIAVFVLGTAAALCLQTGTMEAVTQDSEERPMGLIGILFGLGRDYDCFFTIEDGSKEGEVGNRLESELARRTLPKGGLVRELEQLRQDVPNFSYEFNPADLRIVHIIDSRLKQQKGYALEVTIKSLDFSGTVDKLPDRIGKQGISIVSPTGFFTHEQPDFSTEVQVKGEGLSVRSALSNFIRLEGRERVLWIARTRLEPGAISYVFYRWPGNMTKQ